MTGTCTVTYSCEDKFPLGDDKVPTDAFAVFTKTLFSAMAFEADRNAGLQKTRVSPEVDREMIRSSVK